MAHTSRPPTTTTGQTNVERIQAMLRFGGGGGGGWGGGGGQLAAPSGETDETVDGDDAPDAATDAAATDAAEVSSSPSNEDEDRAVGAAERERERLARAERARARAAREKEMARRKAVLDRKIEQQQLRAKQQQQQQQQQQQSEREQGGEGEGAEGAGEGLRHSPEGEERSGGGGGGAATGSGGEDKKAGMGATAGVHGDTHAAGGEAVMVGAEGGGGDFAAAESDGGENSAQRLESVKMQEKLSQPRSLPRRAGVGGGGGVGGSGGSSLSSSSSESEHLSSGDDGGSVDQPEDVPAGMLVTNKGGGGGGGASQSPAVTVVVALRPTVGTPLTPKIQRILKKLADVPAVLTNRRLRDHARISCGGTGAVAFKTWNSFFHAAENLTRTLPDANPPLPLIAAYAQQHCRHRGVHCDFTNMEQEAAVAGEVNSPPSCAIVGNGGRLRYETHGEEIDAADVVVRFNNGRTKGFERQVGRRSHFRFYNGPSVEPKQAGEVTVAQLRDPAVSHWAKQYLKHRDNFPEAYVMDPEVICHAWDMVDREGDKPSSGLVGIAWAMRLCRSVDVYGFQFDAYFNATMRPHYYDWERPKPGREHAHPFERERDLYLSLAAAGLLTLH